MYRHALLALAVLPLAACAAGIGDAGLEKSSVAVYGDGQAAAMWKGERERSESGTCADPYGLRQPRNVPVWEPIPLPPGSVAAVFEPGRTLRPVAIAVTVMADIPLAFVFFLERCSAADLSAPACWAKWEERPWNVAMNEGVALANPRRAGRGTL